MDKELLVEARQAIKNNDVEKIRQMLAENADVLEIVTPFGTLLHEAAIKGSLEIARVLVEAGIDVNKRAGFGDNAAIAMAAFHGYKEIVDYLLNNGADLDVSTADRNPLLSAIYNGHTDVAKLLIDQGIDLKASYRIGKIEKCDACEYARQYGRTDIVKYIKEKQGA